MLANAVGATQPRVSILSYVPSCHSSLMHLSLRIKKRETRTEQITKEPEPTEVRAVWLRSNLSRQLAHSNLAANSADHFLTCRAIFLGMHVTSSTARVARLTALRKSGIPNFEATFPPAVCRLTQERFALAKNAKKIHPDDAGGIEIDEGGALRLR